MVPQEQPQILISSQVITQILDLASASHPREYMAYLGGKIKQSTVRIDTIYYHHFVSDSFHTLSTIHFGSSTKDHIGTVHCHPSGNNTPSDPDLDTFLHYPVNIIIGYPYRRENIALYDGDGKRATFKEVADKQAADNPPAHQSMSILRTIGFWVVAIIMWVVAPIILLLALSFVFQWLFGR